MSMNALSTGVYLSIYITGTHILLSLLEMCFVLAVTLVLRQPNAAR